MKTSQKRPRPASTDGGKLEGAADPRGPLRVMIVDDYDVVRTGVRAMLEGAGGITVVGEAATAAEAMTEAERLRPAVILMDVRLGEGNGIEAAREILGRLPGTRILMLTSFADDEAVVAAALAGASGYVLKEVAGGRIVESVRAVARGEVLLDPATTESIRNRLEKGKLLLEAKLALLSPQEERVLEQIALGKTNHAIALSLNLTEKTVKNYVSNLLMKLNVARRSEAAAYLARHARGRAAGGLKVTQLQGHPALPGEP